MTLKLILKCETAIFLKRHKLQKFHQNKKAENININRIEVLPRVSKNGVVFRYDDKDIQKIKKQKLIF